MPKRLLIFLLLFFGSISSLFATTYNVTDASTLNTALAAVVGDDIINMADGNYDYVSTALIISRSGTSGHPILMQSTNYRGATIRFTVSGNNLYRHNGNYWTLKNFVVDGQSARPQTEGLLTFGNTNGSPVVHDITVSGVRLRKSGSAGMMICEANHDFTITDLHVDGTGYNTSANPLHGEGLYYGSVGAVQYYNITTSDSILEDNVENIIDCHPNGLNISFNRIVGRNQVLPSAHGNTNPFNARQSIVVANSSTGVSFTDVTLQNNNAGENVFWTGTNGGTVTFTRLIVQTSTTNSSLLDTRSSAFTMTGSEFWNVNNTTVNAPTTGGTQSITTTCGSNASGSGDSLACSTPSTPKFWQRQENATSSGTSLAKAFTLNNTAGSILVCEAVTGADVSATSSVTDTLSNTWSRAYHSGGKLNVYYALNVAAGANTVTFNTGAGATSIRMVIREERGVDANTVLASSAVASGTTGTVNSGNVTTGQNNNLLIQSCSADSPITLTKDSNFTLRFFNGGDTLLTADRVPATGTYSSTCTQSGSQTIRSGILNFGPPTATGTIEVGSIPDLSDGVTFTIPWSSHDLSGGQNVDIFVSYDSAVTYSTVVSNTTDDGQYDWTVSGPSNSVTTFKVCGHTSTTVCGTSNTFRKKGKYL